jgi:hypothetical protein
VKGTWLLAAALLAAASLSRVSADSAAYQKAILADKDLVGFWTFEDNFADQTANKNDAKPGGAVPTDITFVDGVNGGRAVHINNPLGNDADTGTGSYVEVNSPVGSVFDQQKFTVLYWARNDNPAVASGDNEWNSLFDRNSLWYTELWSGDQDNTLGQNLVVRLYNNDGNADTGQIGRYDTPIADRTPFWVKKGEWHQYAMTYDGAKLTTYTDAKQMLSVDYDGGVLPNADTDPNNPPHGNYNLTWGAWQQHGDWYTGAFDDTAYFKRALTADEIKAFYDAMQAKAQ